MVTDETADEMADLDEPPPAFPLEAFVRPHGACEVVAMLPDTWEEP
jgi:hypothetical protein